MTSFREEIFRYVKKKYKTSPEYLWRRFPDYVVLRHEDNRKWYGLIMDVPREKLGLPGSDDVDILNLKLEDQFLADVLIRQEGYFKGYHISRGSWISVLLDGTVPLKEIRGLIDDSFMTTASKQKKQTIRPAKEWIVPANPKYYDIEHAFDETEEIDWKQSAGIKSGDVVYLYVAAPVSAILYQCKVTETGIPCRNSDRDLTITALMKIKLQKRYASDAFTFDRLKEEFGISAVRGPRGITNSLSEALKKGGSNDQNLWNADVPLL